MSNSIFRIFDYCLPIAQWLVSPACLLCGDGATRDGLCAGCRGNLPALPVAHCPACAIPFASGGLCGRCLARPPAFDRVVAAFMYQYPVSELVQSLKYRGSLACARPLAAGLADALDQEPYPDVIVPMPLAPARLADRGFNQALELARCVAAEFGQPLAPHACRRLDDRTPQATLPWKRRAANVRGVFACDLDVSGKSVAVVDDVLTTGATLNELAVTLKRRGAREVVGWIVARTPAPGDA